MKCIRIYSVVAVMISGVMLMSCEKDVHLKMLLESIEFSQDNHQIMFDYEYDSKNRLTKRILHNYGAYPAILNFNTEGDLLEYKYEGSRPRDNSYATFSRNSNIITFVYSGMIPGYWNEKGEIELNVHGFPVKLTSEYNELGFSGYEKTVSSTITLTWHNGNITKEEWEEESVILRYEYENGKELIETIEDSSAGTNTFTHDGNKTPFNNCTTPKWVLWWLNRYPRSFINGWYNANNIKTKTRANGCIITYDYTYNKTGFPMTQTWKDQTSTYSIAYTYNGK
jgi:hypothetical protein